LHQVEVSGIDQTGPDVIEREVRCKQGVRHHALHAMDLIRADLVHSKTSRARRATLGPTQ
jgi:hypothetical protein